MDEEIEATGLHDYQPLGTAKRVLVVLLLAICVALTTVGAWEVWHKPGGLGGPTAAARGDKS